MTRQVTFLTVLALVQITFLGQAHHQVLSDTKLHHGSQLRVRGVVTSSVLNNNPITDVTNNEFHTTKEVYRRVRRADGNGFSFSAYRNFPGIGFFNVSSNGLRGLGFSFGRGGSDQNGVGYQMQRIVKSAQGLGNSVVTMFRDTSSTAGHNIANRINQGLQTWSKTINNLGQAASTNYNTYSNNQNSQSGGGNGGQSWKWQVSWRNGR